MPIRYDNRIPRAQTRSASFFSSSDASDSPYFHEIIYRLAAEGKASILSDYLVLNKMEPQSQAAYGYAYGGHLDLLEMFLLDPEQRSRVIPAKIVMHFTLGGFLEKSDTYYKNLPTKTQEQFDHKSIQAHTLAMSKQYDLLESFHTQTVNSYLIDSLYGFIDSGDFITLEIFRTKHDINYKLVEYAFALKGNKPMADYYSKYGRTLARALELEEDGSLKEAPYYKKILYGHRLETIFQLAKRGYPDQAVTYYNNQPEKFKSCIDANIYIAKGLATGRQFALLNQFYIQTKDDYIHHIAFELAFSGAHAEVVKYQTLGASVHEIARGYAFANNYPFADLYRDIYKADPLIIAQAFQQIGVLENYPFYTRTLESVSGYSAKFFNKDQSAFDSISDEQQSLCPENL